MPNYKIRYKPTIGGTIRELSSVYDETEIDEALNMLNNIKGLIYYKIKID